MYNSPNIILFHDNAIPLYTTPNEKLKKLYKQRWPYNEKSLSWILPKNK